MEFYGSDKAKLLAHFLINQLKSSSGCFFLGDKVCLHHLFSYIFVLHCSACMYAGQCAAVYVCMQGMYVCRAVRCSACMYAGHVCMQGSALQCVYVCRAVRCSACMYAGQCTRVQASWKRLINMQMGTGMEKDGGGGGGGGGSAGARARAWAWAGAGLMDLTIIYFLKIWKSDQILHVNPNLMVI